MCPTLLARKAGVGCRSPLGPSVLPVFCRSHRHRRSHMSPDSPVSRRSALKAIGVAGAATPLLAKAAPAAAATPLLIAAPGTSNVAPVQGLHLTFGADPASEMVASWITDAAVRKPR